MAIGDRLGPVLQSILPTAPILIPLAVHFILVDFVLLSTTLFSFEEGFVNWLPLTFLFSHLILFIVGLWTAQDKENILPVIVFIFVVVVTAFNDIIQLGLFFSAAQDTWGDGDNKLQRTWQFSAAMMILNLLGKPVTIGLACFAAYIRTGGSLPIFRFGRGGDSYQPVHGTTTPTPSAGVANMGSGEH